MRKILGKYENENFSVRKKIALMIDNKIKLFFQISLVKQKKFHCNLCWKSNLKNIMKMKEK